jgi:hypothetical protein
MGRFFSDMSNEKIDFDAAAQALIELICLSL